MKVKRTIKVDTDEFEVGDIIKFKLTDGEKVQAKAVKQTTIGMLFVLVDCLTKEYPMFESIENMSEDYFTYENSDLRKALNGEILARFPEKILIRMVALNELGDLLRIPTEREIFGKNIYGQLDDKKQWKSMKTSKNRIALQGKEGASDWYWLMNRHEFGVHHFVHVDYYGDADCNDATGFLGVRPVFLLSSPPLSENLNTNNT